MTILTGPYAGMMAAILPKYQEYIEELKTKSASKYGFCQKIGFNIPFVRPIRLAEQFDTSVKTLERLRKTEQGPPFFKLCTGQIQYPIIELEKWIDARMHYPNSDSE